ncbi:TPA: hypothetical protein O8U24_001839 [Enterobacter kobei]|nr:hypothetical protein [Enterobacter kobei]
MKFTLKEMNGLLSGKCLPSDLLVGETLADYLIRKFDDAQQQLAESHRALRAETTAHDHVKNQLEKMAAENAGLIKFITQECHVAHIEPETFYEEEITRYVSADGYQPETTATDAYLAEVRAQGVEMFGQYHNFSEKLFIQKEAQKFAAQIRKGGQS